MTKESLAPALEGAATDEAAAVEPGRTSAFAALAYRDFRLFWFGLVISNIGTWMQLFGLGWLVVQLANRDGVPQLAPFYLGLVGLARAVPGLTFGLLGGVVADRADRRRLLLVTQTTAGLIAGALAVLTITERINIVEVLLLGALSSITFAFDAPTRQAMVPRLVSDRELMSAIGLNSAAFNGATVVGPLLGGVLLAPIGVGGLMALNAMSYLAIIVALVAMTPHRVEAPLRAMSTLESIREGLAYIRQDTPLLWTVVLSTACALLARPYIQLLPAVAHDALGVGAVELSWLLAGSGAGALTGALLTASLGGFQRRGAVLVASVFSTGVLLVAFSLQRTLVPAIVLLALTSLAVMLFLGMANTLLQTRTPDHLRGRAMSVQSMVFMGFMPLGTMLLGSVGTVTGIDTALLGGGVVVALLAAFVALRVEAVREVTAASRPRQYRPFPAT